MRRHSHLDRFSTLFGSRGKRLRERGTSGVSLVMLAVAAIFLATVPPAAYGERPPKPTLILETGEHVGIGRVWVKNEYPIWVPGYGGCLVVRSTEPITWNPTDGELYDRGQNVDGSPAIVAYVGGAMPDPGHPVQCDLAPCTTLYYKLWVRDTDALWSQGDQKNCIPYGPCPGVVNPSNLHASPGTSRAELTWSNPFDPNYASTLLVRLTYHPACGSWRPTPGTSYQAGDAVGGGVVVYNASGTRYVDTGLKNLQQYWYKAFVVTDQTTYSWGVSVATTPAKEPTSHYYEFVREWGEPGAGLGQFDPGWGPRGITIVRVPGWDPEVHVSDPGNHRVQAFSLDGEYLDDSVSHGHPYGYWLDDLVFSPRQGSTDWWVIGLGRNYPPYVDTFLWCYYWSNFDMVSGYQIPDIGGDRSSYGSVWQTTIPLNYYSPPAIAAAVSLDDKVWLFTPTLSNAQSWGTSGTADGQLTRPTSIVQDGSSAYLYVGDETGRIQKFLFNGTFVEKIEFPRDDGTMGDRLSEVPLDMAVDRWGCFYVATSGYKILKFDSSWSFLTGWGRKGSGQGEFGSDTRPELRIWVDEDDRVYVADAGNCRVQVFQESDRNGTDIHFNALIAEPVNTCTGNFAYEHTDLEIPGRGIAVVFSRSYNSQSQYEGTLGPGWRHSYDIALPPKVDGSRVLSWGNGREITYVPDPNNPSTYLPASPGVYDALVENGDSTFTLTTAQGQTLYNFTADGQLTTIIDKNGNTLSFAHDALGRLTTITDASGRNLTLDYGVNGKLASLTDALGRQVLYTYTDEGELETVTDASGHATEYSYDDRHQMLTVTDPLGNQVISNTYDLYRRVISQTNARGATTTFDYLTEEVATPYGLATVYKGETVVTEAVGELEERQSTHHYDPLGRLIKMTHPDALTTEYTYDSDNNRTSTKDRNTRTTQYAFDTHGNMTTKTDPKGGTIPITYDTKNDPTSRTDPTGNTTTFEYDAAGNLTKTIDPLGNETVMTYDAQGQLLTTTDALGNVTTNAYDADGNLTSTTDPLGNAWSYTYGAVGRKLTGTDPTGATTQYEYDGNNRVTRAVNALGHESTFEYDGNGNKTDGHLPWDPNVPSHRDLTYAYDQNDNLVSSTDARGNTAQHTYDILDRHIRVDDPLGGQTHFAYDALDRLTSKTDANGNAWAYTYDGNGNRLTATDPKGKTRQYEYDELNRQTVARDPLGNTTTTTYDAAGRVLSVTNAVGDTMSYQYDAAGRKTHQTDYRGNTTQFEYDAVGNLTRVIDPLGHATQDAYDGNRNRISTTNALGQTTQFTYDPLNRLLQTIDALGNTTTNAYDELGRLTSVANANGHAHVYHYNPAGNLIKVTESTGDVTHYTYDKNGNMLTFMNARGHTTTYAYDELNRKTSETNPLSLTRSFTYDAVGNLVTMTDEDGQDSDYQYDENNRLIQVDYPGGPTVTYAYDDAGRRTGMTDGLGTSTYEYDPLGRRIGYEDPFGHTIGYGYDQNSNRTTLIYPDGKQVTYAYDAANRLTTVTDWDSRVTTYVYDDADRLTRVTLSNGTYCDYGYDAAGRLTSRVNRKPDHSVIAGYTLTLNPVGNRTRIESEGALKASPPAEDTSYTYDAASRIVAAGATTFDFSPRGNMIRKTDPNTGVTDYAYDGRDRLVTVSGLGINASYRYDGAGNRLEATDSGVVQRTVLDDDAPLSQLLCRRDDSGTIETYYVYGPGGSLLYEVPAATPAHFFHFDYIGSTVALTNDTNSVTNQYAYDEFGNVLRKNGATDNPFTYVGELGVSRGPGRFICMRARYYQPSLGRFGGIDPVPGDWLTPLTLSAYSYAGCNPMVFMDPTGLWITSGRWMNARDLIGHGLGELGGGGWDAGWGLTGTYLGVTAVLHGGGPLGASASLFSLDSFLNGFSRMGVGLEEIAWAEGQLIGNWLIGGRGNPGGVSHESNLRPVSWLVGAEVKMLGGTEQQAEITYDLTHLLLQFAAPPSESIGRAVHKVSSTWKTLIEMIMEYGTGGQTGAEEGGESFAGGRAGGGGGGGGGGGSGGGAGSSSASGYQGYPSNLSLFKSGTFQSSSNLVPIPLTPEMYEPKYRPINKVRAKDMK